MELIPQAIRITEQIIMFLGNMGHVLLKQSTPRIWDILMLMWHHYNAPSSLEWRHNERDGVSNPDVLIVCSIVCSAAYQRKHQSSTSLAFVTGIHPSPVDSPHKGPVMWKMSPFDDVTMLLLVAHGYSVISGMLPADQDLFFSHNIFPSHFSGPMFLTPTK